MSLISRCSPILLLGGLAGCVVAPVPPPPLPLVAVPGTGKTAADFQQDDIGCRQIAAEPPAAPAPAPATTSAPSTSGVAVSGNQEQATATQEAAMAARGIYLHCMESHNNVVQPLAIPGSYGVYPAYGYAPVFGPYDGYSAYPWLYDGYPEFGFYGGWGWGGGYWGGYRGGWGGYRGGWGGGGYHGGGPGGGGGGRGGR